MGKNSRAVKKTGFTLLEILIVIIIIGALAAMAIPYFIRTVEGARAREAKVNLRLIYTGEKIYRLGTGFYVTLGDVSLINRWLNLDIPENPDLRHFDYSVSATRNTFVATAIKNRSPNIGERITINQDGVLDKAGWSP